jgi:hypothetical protein
VDWWNKDPLHRGKCWIMLLDHLEDPRMEKSQALRHRTAACRAQHSVGDVHRGSCTVMNDSPARSNRARIDPEYTHALHSGGGAWIERIRRFERRDSKSSGETRHLLLRDIIIRIHVLNVIQIVQGVRETQHGFRV